jgi:hypothetical protein
MASFETRRGFLGGLLVVAGGIAAAALAGCASPEQHGEKSVGPAGATEILQASPDNPYANVMPDHVAAVRA